jgi:Ca2+-binding EF-hand superfamily protein
MIRMPFLLSLICVAGLATASPPATPPIFSVHDQNQDGYLDRAEYTALQAACTQRRGARCAAAMEKFDALDADRDDRVSETELLHVLGRRFRGGQGEQHPQWNTQMPKPKEKKP